jgi:hypothetical protein
MARIAALAPDPGSGTLEVQSFGPYVRGALLPAVPMGDRHAHRNDLILEWRLAETRCERLAAAAALVRTLTDLGPWEVNEFESRLLLSCLHEAPMPWCLLDCSPEMRIVDANAQFVEIVGADRLGRVVGSAYPDWLDRAWRRWAARWGYLASVAGDTALLFFRELKTTTGHTLPVVGSATSILQCGAMRCYVFVALAPALYEVPYVVEAVRQRGGSPLKTRLFREHLRLYEETSIRLAAAQTLRAIPLYAPAVMVEEL